MKIKLRLLTVVLFFLGCSSVQRQPATENSDQKEFKIGINKFEEAGGTGKWLQVKSPFETENYAAKKYYRILTIPKVADVNSPFHMMRFEHTRSFVEKMLIGGTPVILGQIDLSTGIYAMTFPKDDEFSVQTFKTSGIGEQSSVILIQLTADSYTVQHEYRHWQDQQDKQNPTYTEALLNIMNPLFKKNLISRMDVSVIHMIISEIRGYSVQMQALRRDRKAHRPVVTMAGKNILESDLENSNAWYISEEYDALRRFGDGSYARSFFEATSNIRKQKGDYDKFIKDLEKFDYSDDPENAVTLRKIGITP